MDISSKIKAYSFSSSKADLAERLRIVDIRNPGSQTTFPAHDLSVAGCGK